MAENRSSRSARRGGNAYGADAREVNATAGLPRRADRHAQRRPTHRDPRQTDRRATAAPRDYFLLVLVALALAKAALSRGLGLGDGNVFGIVFEASAVVFILGAVDLVWSRRSYAIDLVVYTALSALMLANVMYASFFGEVFSPHMLSAVGQAGEVSDSIKAIVKPIYVLYLADVPFLAAWALLTWRDRREAPPRQRRQVVLASGIALLLLGVQVALMLGLSTDVDGETVARARGFAPYQIASIVRLALPDPALTAASAFAHEKNLTPAQAVQLEIDRLRHGDKGARIGDVRTGQYKGKNVIVVQVEALQDFVIGKRFNDQEITPNLNRLVDTSWYFPNTYSETSGGNTVDAEFTVNTSLFAPVTGASPLEYADRELPGLPRVLRANGYDAITLHQNDVRFWNRINLYPSLGFRRYWDRSYFQDRDRIWHASDQILFSYGMKVLRSEETSTKPFYSFFITESSHTAFKGIAPARRPLKVSAADIKTLSGGYVGSISYTDMAIGEFIADLKQDGLWDKSILVIYGDHSALLDRGVKAGDSRVADEVLGRPYSDVDRQRIPLIIHLPGQTSAEVSEKPVGQIDIMPTIADLVGVDISAVPHMGRSAFVNAPALIPTRAYLPGGSFVDDRVLFMPGMSFDDGKAVDVLTAQAAAPTDLERIDYAVVKRLNQLSDAWIKSLPRRAGAGTVKDAIIPH